MGRPLTRLPAGRRGQIGLGRRLSRSFLAHPAPQVAPALLGRVVVAASAQGEVAVRLTEVEAYAGTTDPASHAFRGPTTRTAVMFGPAGHLYLYFVYGMHWCANVVVGPDGEAAAVLLRGGEVVRGLDLARSRRPRVRADRDLAKGPAGLTAVLGWDAAVGGADLIDSRDRLPSAVLRAGRAASPDQIRSGPRVGITRATELPWRFWIDSAPGVTAFRPGVRRPR